MKVIVEIYVEDAARREWVKTTVSENVEEGHAVFDSAHGMEETLAKVLRLGAERLLTEQTAAPPPPKNPLREFSETSYDPTAPPAPDSRFFESVLALEAGATGRDFVPALPVIQPHRRAQESAAPAPAAPAPAAPAPAAPPRAAGAPRAPNMDEIAALDRIVDEAHPPRDIINIAAMVKSGLAAKAAKATQATQAASDVTSEDPPAEE